MNTLFVTLMLSSALAEQIEQLPLQKVQIGTKSIEVEVADELHERQRGLMFRKTMDADHGMLFVYSEPEPRSFWMKNTYKKTKTAFFRIDEKICCAGQKIEISIG